MSSQRGAVAESIVCTTALRRGRDVLFPMQGQSLPYDMVIRATNGKLLKVQVKRAHVRVRNRTRSLRVNIIDSSGRPYSPSEVDIMAIVDVDTFRTWFIPLEDLGGKVTATVSSPKYDRYIL